MDSSEDEYDVIMKSIDDKALGMLLSKGEGSGNVSTANPPAKRKIANDQKRIEFVNDFPVKKTSKVVQLSIEQFVASDNRGESKIIQEHCESLQLLKKAMDCKTTEKNEIVSHLTINWIKNNSSNFVSTATIPLLFAIVQRNNKKENSVTVKDSSGSIVAVLDDKVCSKLKDKLIVGSSVAIRNCTFTRKQNITKIVVAENNLICIASTAPFVDKDLKIPSWSDFVFYRKPDSNGIWILQFATIDYDDIKAENLALL